MRTAFINGIILDGTENMSPVEGKVIFVEDKLISAIEDIDKSSLAGCKVVDLEGAYILPGLINLHVHIAGTGKPSEKPINIKLITKLLTSLSLGRVIGCKIIAANARTALMAGITTLRSVGSIADFDSRVRNKIKSGRLTGPRILTANCAVSVEGGHMAGSFAYEARSSEDAARLVDKIAADKPDLIKLMVTGGVMDGDKVGEPGVLRMPPELIKAASERAHRLGYKVAAHCEGQEGVCEALRNGVDSIEHGAKPNAEIISLFKEKKAAQVVTLTPAIPYAMRMPGVFNLSEAAVTNSRIVMDGMIELAKECLKEGVSVGLGTDSGCSYATQYDFWRELVYFVKYCGVNNGFALHTATLVNARIAGIDDITGSIEVGKSADMIVVEKDPLKDLSALRNVRRVIFEGKQIDCTKLRKLPEVEKALDLIL